MSKHLLEGINRHYNKIIKSIEKFSDLEYRRVIIVDYCERFNQSSDGYWLYFSYDNMLCYQRKTSFSSSGQEIDLSNYLDLSYIRNEKINSILYGK